MFLNDNLKVFKNLIFNSFFDIIFKFEDKFIKVFKIEEIDYFLYCYKDLFIAVV